MTSKILMVVSSVLMGVAGVAAIFAPAELLSGLGLTDIAPPVLVQLLGTLYFAFAITNWTARHNPIGGIYSRPLALGNFAHFMIGTLVLIRPAMALPKTPLIVSFVIYLVFALLFGALLFGQGPVRNSAPKRYKNSLTLPTRSSSHLLSFPAHSRGRMRIAFAQEPIRLMSRIHYSLPFTFHSGRGAKA